MYGNTEKKGRKVYNKKDSKCIKGTRYEKNQKDILRNRKKENQ